MKNENENVNEKNNNEKEDIFYSSLHSFAVSFLFLFSFEWIWNECLLQMNYYQGISCSSVLDTYIYDVHVLRLLCVILTSLAGHFVRQRRVFRFMEIFAIEPTDPGMKMEKKLSRHSQ